MNFGSLPFLFFLYLAEELLVSVHIRTSLLQVLLRRPHAFVSHVLLELPDADAVIHGLDRSGVLPAVKLMIRRNAQLVAVLVEAIAHGVLANGRGCRHSVPSENVVVARPIKQSQLIHVLHDICRYSYNVRASCLRRVAGDGDGVVFAVYISHTCQTQLRARPDGTVVL